ncbi:MAG TPA: nuclear transport factor 2 family protein [Acidimicrobiales bacterium]|nr:nuclear transport factor 2 family protein [Acidimicrobiales bacterium]
MSAHDDLRALVQRYARAADARDVPALEALFHPDAELDGVRGVMSLPQWLDTMRAPRGEGYSMHMLGDPLIALDEAAGMATLDTYGVVYAPDRTLGMRYLDEAVHVRGRWVIRRRVSRIVWSR